MMTDTELQALEAKEAELWKASRIAKDEYDARLNLWHNISKELDDEKNKRRLLAELKKTGDIPA